MSSILCNLHLCKIDVWVSMSAKFRECWRRICSEKTHHPSPPSTREIQIHLPPARYSICPAVAIHLWERTHCSRFDFNFASPARSCQSSQKKTRRNQYFSISVLTLTQSWLILRNCNSIVSYYIQSQENCEISFHQVLRCDWKVRNWNCINNKSSLIYALICSNASQLMKHVNVSDTPKADLLS